jgi:hypothetical protein
VAVEEATSLDSSCARRLAALMGRDEETGFQIEAEGRKMGLLKLLDKKSPIQGVQSLL